jgi:hypothetical protein
MYVRSKILLLVVLPPQMWVLGDVRTVSVRPPCDLLRIRRAALSKRPCRAPSVNAASTRGIFVYAHNVYAHKLAFTTNERAGVFIGRLD